MEDNMTNIIKETEQIINILDLVYARGYDKGYNNRKIEEEFEEKTNNYEKGLNDAWECVKKIALTKSHRTVGEYQDYLKEIFGTTSASTIIDTLSVYDVISKIKKYEEKHIDNEIKVGDEVIHDGEQIGIVTQVDEFGYQIMESGGESGFYITEDIRKTNRHFPQIAEVLKQIREKN